uniref:U32 family peptidase n=1 Tax=Geoglobus ahangari TaxID=113653 RepID=A0A7C3YEV1_9EURY
MELTTNVPNLESMSECSLKPYDAVYLGMPFCFEYQGNLITEFDDLEVAVNLLRKWGKKAYVTTFAVPRNKDLEKVYRTVEKAAEIADAIEASNLGVIRYITREYPDVRVHVGGLANVYTVSTAELLYSLGVSRIMPAYELPIEDIEKIKETGVEVELVAHGKIPVGIGHECFLKRFSDTVGKDCPKICMDSMFFKSEELVLKPFGHATLSGKDICMYEHIEKISFADALRIETISERIGYREAVGRIYRRRIEKGFSKTDFEKLKELAEHGIANGFYFNKAGQLYIPG